MRSPLSERLPALNRRDVAQLVAIALLAVLAGWLAWDDRTDRAQTTEALGEALTTEQDAVLERGDEPVTPDVADIEADPAAALRGDTGPAGSSGRDGVNGTDGDPGQDGVDGLSGPQGAPGAPGTTGDTGPPGPIGPAGPQGAPGGPGSNGPPGSDGVPGPAGPEGAPGSSGTTGPAGLDGAPGTAGTTGDPGTPGADGSPGAPPAGWTYTDVSGTSYSCAPTDPFDPAAPTYSCQPLQLIGGP